MSANNTFHKKVKRVTVEGDEGRNLCLQSTFKQEIPDRREAYAFPAPA